MRTEDAHGGGGHPVHQWRFVEEAHSVDIGNDIVVSREHLARDLGVNGVDIVEQAGSKEAANLKNEPDQDDDRDRGWTPGLFRLEPYVSIGAEARRIAAGTLDGATTNCVIAFKDGPMGGR